MANHAKEAARKLAELDSETAIAVIAELPLLNDEGVEIGRHKGVTIVEWPAEQAAMCITLDTRYGGRDYTADAFTLERPKAKIVHVQHPGVRVAPTSIESTEILLRGELVPVAKKIYTSA